MIANVDMNNRPDYDPEILAISEAWDSQILVLGVPRTNNLIWKYTKNGGIFSEINFQEKVSNQSKLL